MRTYSCDFEATIWDDVTEEQAKQLPTEVWLAAALDCDDPHGSPIITYSIDEFMKSVVELGSCNLSFHNLEGYDSWFVLNWLARNGYKHVKSTDIAPDHNHYVGDRQSFSVFTKINGDWLVHNFIDSRVMLQGSVRSIGESLGEVFKGDETPVVEHGSLLTETKRQNGDMWTWEAAIDYITNDVRVMALALNKMHVLPAWDSGLRTAAALAYNCVWMGEDIRESDQVKRSDEIRSWHSAKIKDHPSLKIKGLGFFKPKNPLGYVDMLTGEELDKKETQKYIAAHNLLAKSAYKGGYNYCNPRMAGKELGEGTVLDINSMYPWIYSTKPLPRIPGDYTTKIMKFKDVKAATTVQQKFEVIAKKLQAKSDEGYWPLINVCDLKATCHPHATPIIKPQTQDSHFKNVFVTGEDGRTRRAVDGYTYHIDYPGRRLPITLPEFQYLVEHYDIDRGYISAVHFYTEDRVVTPKLREHADRWMPVKQNATGSDKMYAKLMLNSPYGKLGQYTRSYPNHEYKLVNGRVVNCADKDQDKPTGGKAHADLITASYITAWGRVYLAETINKIGMDRFIYCDTDSVHLLGTPTTEELQSWGIKADPHELGAWDIEHYFDRALYIKCKHYGYNDINTGWRTTCAGYTQQIPEEEFKIGNFFPTRRAVPAVGGALIVTKEMEIKEAWKDRLPDQSYLNGFTG